VGEVVGIHEHRLSTPSKTGDGKYTTTLRGASAGQVEHGPTSTGHAQEHIATLARDT